MIEKITDILLNILFLIFSPVLLLISLICFLCYRPEMNLAT